MLVISWPELHSTNGKFKNRSMGVNKATTKLFQLLNSVSTSSKKHLLVGKAKLILKLKTSVGGILRERYLHESMWHRVVRPSISSSHPQLFTKVLIYCWVGRGRATRNVLRTRGLPRSKHVLWSSCPLLLYIERNMGNKYSLSAWIELSLWTVVSFQQLKYACLLTGITKTYKSMTKIVLFLQLICSKIWKKGLTRESRYEINVLWWMKDEDIWHSVGSSTGENTSQHIPNTLQISPKLVALSC